MYPAPVSDTPPSVIETTFIAQGPRAVELRISTARERIGRLKRLKAELLNRRQELCDAFARDFGKPAAEVEMTELLPVLDEIRTAIKSVRRWMRPKGVWPTLATAGTSARITYQGKGRCLIMSPWNYPVATLIGPLVSAVAAGNTAILKPSEFTPFVNAVLNEVIVAAFEATDVVMVQGGVEVAQALLACPFDHIYFTGSTAVGREVMAAAAKHLTSVTLELGGKSPVIVDQTADLGRAAEVILWGKLLNAGQTCVAPDTLYVHRTIHDDFIRRLGQAIARRYGSSAAAVAASPDLARMIHGRHAHRLAAMIDEACSGGATLAAGGQHDVAKRFIAPTILSHVPANAQIMREEIFGPVLPVVAFDDIDTVIRDINVGAKPLALYLWSRNKKTIRRVLGETSSGGAVVNNVILHFAHTGLPFGGIGNSGIGSGHGIFGFKAFSHERAELRGSTLLPIKLFCPPYTRLSRCVIGLLGGWF